MPSASYCPAIETELRQAFDNYITAKYDDLIYDILTSSMSDNVSIAIIGGSTTFLTALASLLLVYRGFSSIERRLEVIEGNLKQFYKDLTRHESEISSLKNRQK